MAFVVTGLTGSFERRVWGTDAGVDLCRYDTDGAWSLTRWTSSSTAACWRQFTAFALTTRRRWQLTVPLSVLPCRQRRRLRLRYPRLRHRR